MLKCRVTGRGIIGVKGGAEWVCLSHAMPEREGDGGAGGEKLSAELRHIFPYSCEGVGSPWQHISYERKGKAHLGRGVRSDRSGVNLLGPMITAVG